MKFFEFLKNFKFLKNFDLFEKKNSKNLEFLRKNRKILTFRTFFNFLKNFEFKKKKKIGKNGHCLESSEYFSSKTGFFLVEIIIDANYMIMINFFISTRVPGHILSLCVFL